MIRIALHHPSVERATRAGRCVPVFDSSILRKLVVLVLLAVPAAASETEAPLLLPDLDGRRVDPLSGDAKATVFLFVRSDCPISNRYAPEVGRLHERFSRRDVEFWLVYPDPDETTEAIRRHMEEYGYRFGALRDPGHELVRRTGAKVTPEAVVFDGSGALVYRGRIDDRYVAFGKARAAATSHDLEDALQAVLDGGTVRNPTTKAVGCFIADLK